jgi:tetratricopeptide (TPR) repeat protein
MCGYHNHSVSNVKDFFSSKTLRLLLCLHLIISPFTIIAQTSQASRLKIDSLKKVLLSLYDSASVDCLNELSEAYLGLPDWFSDTPPPMPQYDTAEIFALQALEKSKKMYYFYGMARAISLKAELAFEKYNNYPEAEKLSREAISSYKKTANKKGLYKTYLLLGMTLHSQSNFEGARNNYDTAYALSKKAGDSLYMFYAAVTSIHVNESSGDYEKAFEKMPVLHQLVLTNGNAEWKSWELYIIAELYFNIEDYSTALKYYRQVTQLTASGFLELANMFAYNKQLDSAKYYYNFVVADTGNKSNFGFYLVGSGEYYFFQKKYDKALQYLLKGLNYNEQTGDVNQVMRSLLLISKTYFSLQNNNAAFKYAYRALALGKEKRARQVIRDACEILSAVYDLRHQSDSAYSYFRQYTTMKDSVLNNNMKGKLVAYGLDQKIELLNKEKQIQQVQLQNQSLLKNILIAGIIIFLLLTAVIFRNILLKQRNEANRRELAENELQLQKLESEKTKAEFKQQTTELEMQALRAQMTPHFIFNSLNSINRFILQNNKAEASEYLTKFSRLVRLILQNSQSALIPLESELESLQLYLELEAVRFDHHFEFNIKVDDDLETDIIKVPPLIIQPYAENAIWHGLMHKEEKGHLNIELYQEEDILCCKITDDGIGRKKAAELKSKSNSTHKSMGMQITASRIEILQQKKQLDTYIKITDLILADGSAGGTEVILKIPIMQ